VEHVAQQVKELKKNLTEMKNKLKKAPEDFQQQMDKFLEVHVQIATCHKTFHLFANSIKKRKQLIICVKLIYNQ